MLKSEKPLHFMVLKVKYNFNLVAVCTFSIFAFNYTYAQNVTVTGANTGNGTYITLSAAFIAINGDLQSGADIVISLSGNTTEPVTGAELNSGLWESILILPTGGQPITVSASVNPGSALINFNGADYVTIDGLNSGGNSLTFSNTTVSSVWGTSTIRFENKTNNNVVTRCTVLGSSTSISAGANIYFGTTTSPGPGNNFNSISYCNIGPAGTNLPASGITSFGTIGYNNTGDTIRNCNIYDYFSSADSSAGIFLPLYNSGFVIKDNKFYQTSLRTQTIGAPHAAVSIFNSYGSNFTISGNKIGYSTSSGTGLYSFTGVGNSFFYGINAENPFFASMDIHNNTVAGISISGSMTMHSVKLINVNNCVSANITGNTIGSVTSPGSITYNSNTNYNMIYGISCYTQNSAAVNGNTIGSITASNSDPSGGCQIYAISITAPAAICNYNNIGGRIPNSIYTVTTSTIPNTSVYGILCNSEALISGNTITNLTSEGGNSGGVYPQVVGISGSNTISQNFIYGLSCSAMFGRIVGISGSGLISRNIIHSFSSPDTATTFIGISSINSGTVQNNMLRFGLDTSGNSMNTGCTIYGLHDENGSNFYFNSIYIGGTATSGTSNTYCLKSKVQNSTRNYLNNILYNVRTNSLADVSHFAVGIDNTNGLNSNYNILFAPNKGGKTGYFNGSVMNNIAAWRASTNLDNNSHAKDPYFFNPTSSFFFGLQISGAPTPVEQNGIPISGIEEDFYGAPRSFLTPTDIGAHCGNFTQTGGPLSGDYLVGLSLFNSMAGTSIYFEKSIRKVLKEIADSDINSDGSSDYRNVKMVKKEVEEEIYVPMQNGEIYTGPLFIKRSDNPDIFTNAINGIYATINTALNDIYTSGANGAVRFLLTDTLYSNEALPIFIGNWPNASVVNTLTIKPRTGVTTLITGISSAIFDINSADHFILDGSNTANGNTKDLTVSNFSETGTAIQFINDARINTIKNCILKGNSSSSSNGVVTFLTTTGSEGNDSNTIQNNDITSNSGQPNYCLYNKGSGSSSNQKNSHNRIIGNRIFNFAIRGITDEGNSAATLYDGNEIYSLIPMTTRGAGFRTSDSTIEGFIFRNNFIRDLKTSGIPGNDWIYGIELAGIQNSFTGEIYNNFISLSHQTSIDLRGISDKSPGYASYNIYFNSINISGSANTGTNSVSYFNVNDASTNFKNNILVNTRSGGVNYSIRTNGITNNFNSNYNDIYASGSFNYLGRIGISDIGNLSDWRAATGNDFNSISANPLFISSSNLHIDSTQASPLSNIGTAIAGIATDYDNNTRSLTAPDIGADEFNGVNFTVNLKLTTFIEGFYDASSDTQISDTLKIYLKNLNSPYENVDSATSVADANGLCSLTFANATFGSYYIVITHRNSIQTWSANAVAFINGSTTVYNFTVASVQAFGNNLNQVDTSPVRFAVYSGDVNQDGIVDNSDAGEIDNDSFNFVSGYVVTDLTGDGIVDSDDGAIIDNNSLNFVMVITP
ncbi:MAG TPA: hypothetical protein PK536_01695 [Ignavibacteria bacterium]|nr:hypothetical protein [Ignavibacteria bacterium]